jgi:DNA-binding transcriptional LysR family regulator
VGADIAAGRLVHVLPEYKPRELSIYALYAPGSVPNAKLRTFIDTLAKAWSGTPPWERFGERKRTKAKR